ncbi:MAG: F0F1 ATP synthase subunit B [Nitrospirae bacterium]|nr:F0F1 ATP synthase subunit B [Nitrospirota bacterium]
MPQFESHFLTPTLIWTIISFVLLLVLLKKYALPGIMAVLEERSERIREDLEAAERLRKAADALKAENEAGVQRAKVAADEVIVKAQEKAALLLTQNEARMREEAERIIADAHRAIEQERTQALADLRGLAADLAVAAARKFVAGSLDDATRQRLVEESLTELQGQYRG